MTGTRGVGMEDLHSVTLEPVQMNSAKHGRISDKALATGSARYWLSQCLSGGRALRQNRVKSELRG